MFVDEAILELQAGRGGNGCMAFRREKYVEMGGPFGGNGGNGADIIFKVDEGLNTLIDLRYKKLYKADNGEHGQGKGMHGKNAKDLIIKVPLGTVITNMETNLVMADLIKKDDEVVIAHGGRGGRGNMAFATHSNPAPAYCENGEPGEVIKVKVELKLLADVGLVGLPSVGKSTIISKISAAKPKIAAYHFTTLKPNLGVVKATNNRSYVVADLPGLIEGASQGAGLGHRFLRHLERCRVLLHLVDLQPIDGSDPVENIKVIEQELALYSEKLAQKPRWLVFNKCDIHGEDELKELVDDILTRLGRKDDKYYIISAAANIGVKELCSDVMYKLDEIHQMEAEMTDEAKAQMNNENFIWDKPEPPVPEFDDFDDDFDDDFEDDLDNDDFVDGNIVLRIVCNKRLSCVYKEVSELVHTLVLVEACGVVNH